MKKFFFLVLGLFLINISYAQNKGPKDEKVFNDAMMGLLTKLSKADKPEALTSIRNGFARVAAIDENQWLPYYYAAYAGILESYQMEGDAIDRILDEVDANLDKAPRLQCKMDEVMVLQSWAASARIMVNPMTRGAKYGMKAADFLTRAEAINPGNPRIFFLRGQNAFYTPEQFGGGKKVAMPNLILAQQHYKAFKLENELMPNWGKEETEKRLSEMDKIGQETQGTDDSNK